MSMLVAALPGSLKAKFKALLDKVYYTYKSTTVTLTYSSSFSPPLGKGGGTSGQLAALKALQRSLQAPHRPAGHRGREATALHRPGHELQAQHLGAAAGQLRVAQVDGAGPQHGGRLGAWSFTLQLERSKLHTGLHMLKKIKCNSMRYNEIS